LGYIPYISYIIIFFYEKEGLLTTNLLVDTPTGTVSAGKQARADATTNSGS
jgi:hypothetical protein